jgi:hypothetical protein
MNTYKFDIKATGFFTMTVEAETEEQANEMIYDIIHGKNKNNIDIPLADEFDYEIIE